VPLPDHGESFAWREASGLADTLGPLVEIPFGRARGCWWTMTRAVLWATWATVWD
jgi:hypothetical protein